MKYKFRKKYRDKEGELWVRLFGQTVVRISDGCIGNWFDGEGLEEV